jgi:hypothetical protein
MCFGKETDMGVSITVEGLEPAILDRLHVEALRRGVDVDAVIKQVIRDGLGPLATSDPFQMHHDLDALAGTWSAKDAEDFFSATSDFCQCEKDMWK